MRAFFLLAVSRRSRARVWPAAPSQRAQQAARAGRDSPHHTQLTAWPRTFCVCEDTGVAAGKHAHTTEIVDDKQTITASLRQSPRHFAYPFGRRVDFSEAARTLALRAEYTHLYTAESGFFRGDIKNIPRTLVEKDQSIASVRRWVGGGYDIFPRIVTFVRG